MQPQPPVAQDTDSTNLPAPVGTTALVEGHVEHRPTLQPRQNIAVAFMPLALVAFIIIAFVVAAWTLIAAVGG